MDNKISTQAKAELVRVLGQRYRQSPKMAKTQILDEFIEAVKEALIVTWEAADRICGKRLKAILPTLVDAMERHGHMNLESVRSRTGMVRIQVT